MLIRLVCLFLLSAQVSQAVAMDRVRIIGRGIEDRKNGEVLMIACVGAPHSETQLNSCNQVQAVKHDPKENRFFYLGPIFRVTGQEDPTSDDIRKWAKKLSREVKKNKRKNMSFSSEELFTGAVFVGFIGFIVYMIEWDLRIERENPDNPEAGVSNGQMMLGGAVFAGLILGLKELLAGTAFLKGTAISEAVVDQNGWNWSVSPRKVSHRLFYAMEDYLEDLRRAGR